MEPAARVRLRKPHRGDDCRQRGGGGGLGGGGGGGGLRGRGEGGLGAVISDEVTLLALSARLGSIAMLLVALSRVLYITLSVKFWIQKLSRHPRLFLLFPFPLLPFFGLVEVRGRYIVKTFRFKWTCLLALLHAVRVPINVCVI